VCLSARQRRVQKEIQTESHHAAGSLPATGVAHSQAVPGGGHGVDGRVLEADLLQHGLLRASFVPSRPQRELRDLTRSRSRLAADRARLKSSIQKTLEDTHSKLASVASDSTGQSGRAILKAMLEGEQYPQKRADLARGRMKEKREPLVQARPRTLGAHHRFLLESQLRQLDFVDRQIREVDQEIAQRLQVHSGPDDPDTPDNLPAKEQRSETPARSRACREHAADGRAAGSAQAPGQRRGNSHPR